jgi:hypothetical protein
MEKGELSSLHSRFGRVGGGDEGEGHGPVKRESLVRAGGLQAPARPRRSADGRPIPPACAANPTQGGSADS